MPGLRPLGHRRGGEISPRAVNFSLFAGPLLGALEERQDIVPTPAAITELRPVVVILRLAADVDEPFHRRRATEHAASRIGNGAAVGAGIGLGLEAQVSCLWSSSFMYPTRIRISGFQSRPPASIRITRMVGSSLRRLAKTQAPSAVGCQGVIQSAADGVRQSRGFRGAFWLSRHRSATARRLSALRRRAAGLFNLRVGSRRHRHRGAAQFFLATDGSTLTPLRHRPAARSSQARPPRPAASRSPQSTGA